MSELAERSRIDVVSPLLPFSPLAVVRPNVTACRPTYIILRTSRNCSTTTVMRGCDLHELVSQLRLRAGHSFHVTVPRDRVDLRGQALYITFHVSSLDQSRIYHDVWTRAISQVSQVEEVGCVRCFAELER